MKIKLPLACAALIAMTQAPYCEPRDPSSARVLPAPPPTDADQPAYPPSYPPIPPEPPVSAEPIPAPPIPEVNPNLAIPGNPPANPRLK